MAGSEAKRPFPESTSMKNGLLLTIVSSFLFGLAGCGGGITAGPAVDTPATVEIPPPAEKPKQYIDARGKRIIPK